MEKAMVDQSYSKSKRAAVVNQAVDQYLDDIPAFRRLDAGTQSELRKSMSKIAGYLSGVPTGVPYRPLAGQLAPPDLQQRLSRRDGQQQSEPQTSGQTPSNQGTSPQTGGGQGTTGRVGEVARATLNAIDFPSFVASLIQGTFQAIVDASIQQMQAYAELLKNVATTVDQFMVDNVPDETAKDYLADRYNGLLTRDSSDGQPRLSVNHDAVRDGEMPMFFRELGFESPYDIDEQSIEEVIVPAARRDLAETRQRSLATMVLMGINRVLVDDGEITAKLQFHIDASEAMELRFDQQKTMGGNIAGTAGKSPFTVNAIMVNTTSLNAQSDISVRADLTGQVKVHFISETFPLERFADSAAIQLINQNATVPQPRATSEETTGTGEQSSPPEPATQNPTPAAQSLGISDPWAPREK
jgi:hypothetical protein